MVGTTCAAVMAGVVAIAMEMAGGARAIPTAALRRLRSTLANNASDHHIQSLAPAVALPAPRHDRRRTGAAGSPPGGFPFVEADALCRGSLAFSWGHRGLDP